MNTSSKKSILVIMVFVASIFTVAATERRLRNGADANGRVLESTSMSMVTEYMDIDAIVSKVEKEGEVIDPTNVMLAELAITEYDKSPLHHHGGYEFDTEKCLRLLFILLPDYKASKLSFICGETTPNPTPNPTTEPTAKPTCLKLEAECTSSLQCCTGCKYIFILH